MSIDTLFFLPYFTTRRFIKRTEHFSPQKSRALQGDKLLKILQHSIKHIPFYKYYFDEKSISKDSDPFQEIQRFPIIHKSTLRAHLPAFFSGHPVRRLEVTTGGSTGQPLMFYMDRLTTRQTEKAFIFDMWSRVGYRFGDRIVNLRGQTPNKDKFYVYNCLFNTFYLSSFNINRRTVNRYVNFINSVKPSFLHGYPSTLYTLALFMERENLKLNFSPKAILCGSEKLFPHQRAFLSKVLHGTIYHWYGHSECAVLGGECEYSQTLHFYPQYGYTELDYSKQLSCNNKNTYEILATGLNNFLMPLIRYRTGDYAIKSSKQTCTCGRNYLLVDAILGREQEFVIDNHHEPISATGLIFGQHYDLFRGLDAFQIKQFQPGEIEFFLVKNRNFRNSSFDDMKTKLHSLLGHRMRIIYRFSECISPAPSGKAKLVDQRLDIQKFL